MKILVGAAVAALTGCVAVDAPPTPAPAPAGPPAPVAQTAGPAQEVAPQIVEGPALEALEAALPDSPPPPPPAPSAKPRKAAGPDRATAPRPDPVPHRPERVRPAVPRHPALPPMPELPRLDDLPGAAAGAASGQGRGADVCDLGERYGGWGPGSEQARICRHTQGR